MLEPLLRFMAVGMIIVWFAAVTACSAHCLGDDCQCDSMKMDGAPNSGGQSHDDSDNDDHTFCLSLHHLTPATSIVNKVAPDFKLALALNFLSHVQMPVAEPLDALILCQPPDRRQPLTPEVCPGLAFRSHAPPTLA